MDERRYRLLLRIAIALTLIWILWTLYDSGPRRSPPDAQQLSAAGRQLEDGNYREALRLFETVFRQNENHLGALRGMAQASMQLGLEAERAAQDGTREAQRAQSAGQHFVQALRWYDKAIAAGQLWAKPFGWDQLAAANKKKKLADAVDRVEAAVESGLLG